MDFGVFPFSLKFSEYSKIILVNIFKYAYMNDLENGFDLKEALKKTFESDEMKKNIIKEDEEKYYYKPEFIDQVFFNRVDLFKLYNFIMSKSTIGNIIYEFNKAFGFCMIPGYASPIVHGVLETSQIDDICSCYNLIEQDNRLVYAEDEELHIFTNDDCKRFISSYVNDLRKFIIEHDLYYSKISESKLFPIIKKTNKLDEKLICDICFKKFKFTYVCSGKIEVNNKIFIEIEETTNIMKRYKTHSFGYVVNLGFHWCSLLLKYDEYIYKNSLSINEVPSILKDKLTELGYKNYKTNETILQTDSISCGMYACFSLLESIYNKIKVEKGKCNMNISKLTHIINVLLVVLKNFK